MFVGDEVLLEVSFVVARDRFAHHAERGELFSTSEDAYGQGTVGRTRVGMAGLSKLVRVQMRELAWTDRSAGMAMRWEATGPGGALFPVLDADITLAPSGEQATWLTVVGSYRPPLGAAGEAIDRTILHRVAAATIRSFAARVAAQITGQITGQPGKAETAGPNCAGTSIPADALPPRRRGEAPLFLRCIVIRENRWWNPVPEADRAAAAPGAG
jgi:hypothetical protein